ncbi:MAG: hypothetical protein ABSD61_09400 [Terracidiphilus sp.]
MRRIQRARVVRGWATLFVLCGCSAGLLTGARAQNVAPQMKRVAPSTKTPVVEALFVSDIHFELFADPAKAARLKAAPVSEWNAILAEPASVDQAARFADLQKTCKARGADTSYTLYESSLQAIKTDAADAKFVVLSGDLIAHEFSCKFDTTFPNAKPGEYRAFVEKTINYVMRELRAALPGVPVYAALGNNDSDCGDYELDANSAFLADIGQTLTADFPAGERANALHDFSAGGYYSASTARGCRRRWSMCGFWCWTICLWRGNMRRAAERRTPHRLRRRLRGWSSNWTPRGETRRRCG